MSKILICTVPPSEICFQENNDILYKLNCFIMNSAKNIYINNYFKSINNILSFCLYMDLYLSCKMNKYSYKKSKDIGMAKQI